MSAIEKYREVRMGAKGMSATALVTSAIECHPALGPALAELDRRRGRAPDRAAAECVMRAYEEGRAPDWLAACLLGRVGHPAGYATVLAIAGSEVGRSNSGYVEEAIGRLAGAEAMRDLVGLLREGASWDVRNRAARALAAVGARSAVGAIAAALRADRIAIGPAREALSRLAEPERVEEWLRSDARVDATLGCGVVFAALERQRRGKRDAEGPSPTLARPVLAALGAGTPSLLRYEEEALREWAERVVSEGG